LAEAPAGPFSPTTWPSDWPGIDAGDVRVTLVNDDPDHVYKPVWLYVPFGQREPGDARRPLTELVDDRVDVRIDRVTAIDTDAQRMQSMEGPDPIEYDTLVLATGSTLAPDGSGTGRRRPRLLQRVRRDRPP